MKCSKEAMWLVKPELSRELEATTKGFALKVEPAPEETDEATQELNETLMISGNFEEVDASPKPSTQ
ncbi:hypothetical protein G9A89_017005 [Geosiphon pyriformis]|nr:hypothetical protein G9A89_017005 [Geosiphon pyriformis]